MSGAQGGGTNNGAAGQNATVGSVHHAGPLRDLSVMTRPDGGVRNTRVTLSARIQKAKAAKATKAKRGK